MTIFYDPSCLEFSRPGHPERPERIAGTAPLLKDRHPEWRWQRPRAATDEELLRAHSSQHIEHISTAGKDFDLDTPFYPNIATYAHHSAGAACNLATPRVIRRTRASIRAQLRSEHVHISHVACDERARDQEDPVLVMRQPDQPWYSR